MPKDLNPIKHLVYIGTQYDDKFISRELKKAGYRKLESVRFDGQNVELSFSGELDYKPKKRVLQLSNNSSNRSNVFFCPLYIKHTRIFI